MSIENNVCDICGNKRRALAVWQFFELDDGRSICPDCYLKQHACAICGNIPDNEPDIENAFYHIEDKYYCTEHGKPLMEEKLKSFILTTTPSIDGYKIKEYIGIDSVEIVIGTGWFSEFSGELSDALGLRSSVFEKKLQKAKDLASRLFKIKAVEKNANAIVAADMDYTEFSGNRIGLIINGTLVKIEKVG